MLQRTIATSLVLAWFGTGNVFAGDDIGMCSASDEQLAQARLSSNNDDNAAQFVPRAHRYIDRVQEGDVVLDVRSNQPNNDNESVIKIKNAPKIPLFSLRTKLYLKDKRVILLGDGLDYAQLEQEVERLERARFRFVRILKHGVLGLSISRFEQLSPSEQFRLHLAEPEKLSSAAIQRPQDYYFVNLEDSNQAFIELGFRHTSLSFISNPKFPEQLTDMIRKQVAAKPQGRIVLVHSQTELYRKVFKQVPAISKEKVLFLDTRGQSLADVHGSLRAVAKAQLQTKPSCLR